MNFDPRKHTLPLADVQRIHLGLKVGLWEAEPMDFSADTVADMLQSIVDQVSESNAAKIYAVVRALRGKDKHHRLELRQNSKGKHKMHDARAADRKRNHEWLELLAQLESDGTKTEAAIAEICQRFKVSRATVFDGIKSAELVLEMCRSVDELQGKTTCEHANPRPSKNGKA